MALTISTSWLMQITLHGRTANLDLPWLDGDDLRGITLIDRVSYEYCSDFYSKS
jgi:hypothetical protein